MSLSLSPVGRKVLPQIREGQLLVSSSLGAVAVDLAVTNDETRSQGAVLL